MGESRCFSFKFTFSILVFLTVFETLAAQEEGTGNGTVRRVIANGVNIGQATKTPAISARACPTSLFTFKSPNWLTAGQSQQYPYTYYSPAVGSSNNRNSYFTSFSAGQGFTGDIRICRFDPLNGRARGPGEIINWAYGVENSNGIQPECVLSNTTLNNNYKVYNYEVLYVPKSLNVIWVNQRSFPRFPILIPAPFGINTWTYVARCKIVPDESFDPGYTVTIPGLVSYAIGPVNLLDVSYEEINYQCDSEDLEFAFCV